MGIWTRGATRFCLTGTSTDWVNSHHRTPTEPTCFACNDSTEPTTHSLPNAEPIHFPPHCRISLKPTKPPIQASPNHITNSTPNQHCRINSSPRPHRSNQPPNQILPDHFTSGPSPTKVLPNQTPSTYNWARAIPNQGCQARLHQPKPTSSCIHPRPLLPASLYK